MTQIKYLIRECAIVIGELLPTSEYELDYKKPVSWNQHFKYFWQHKWFLQSYKKKKNLIITKHTNIIWKIKKTNNANI